MKISIRSRRRSRHLQPPGHSLIFFKKKFKRKKNYQTKILKGKWALFAVFCRFSPFSGCFCYKNIFNTARIPMCFVTTIPNSVAHRNIRKKVFLDKINPQKKWSVAPLHFFWGFFCRALKVTCTTLFFF